MKSIICLIIFHTVFGKHFLVEVEKDPKENELSSDQKLDAELSDSLDEDEDMTKTEEGNDYWAPYARRRNTTAEIEKCGGDNSLIILH